MSGASAGRVVVVVAPLAAAPPTMWARTLAHSTITSPRPLRTPSRRNMRIAAVNAAIRPTLGRCTVLLSLVAMGLSSLPVAVATVQLPEGHLDHVATGVRRPLAWDATAPSRHGAGPQRPRPVHRPGERRPPVDRDHMVHARSERRRAGEVGLDPLDQRVAAVARQAPESAGVVVVVDLELDLAAAQGTPVALVDENPADLLGGEPVGAPQVPAVAPGPVPG